VTYMLMLVIFYHNVIIHPFYLICCMYHVCMHNYYFIICFL
jgi:hypothetical protein